ncbi:hypothetical protein ACWGJ2_21510 [Streptomyces sp. NPDC054796]
MDVTFTRTGERRYAVGVSVPGQPDRGMDPAPGYDTHIPHDLVHYVVEAELGLAAGLYGRTAEGGGSFLTRGEAGGSGRDLRRQRRKQRRREDRLREDDHARRGDMAVSERFAGICDLAWRRRHGQRGEAAGWVPHEPLPPEDEAVVERILARLDEVAALWNGLPVGGSLTFAWPAVRPVEAPRAG